MSKAILIMDMPESCLACRFSREINEGIEACCEIVDKLNDSTSCKKIENYCQCKPNWCPLQEVPDKEQGSDCFDEFEDGYAQGWNSCIEEIVGR